MNKALQALIAVTCIVVIACGGWWLYDRNQERLMDKIQRDAVQAAARSRLDKIAAEISAEKNRERQKEIDSCRYDLAARDQGNNIYFVQRAKGGDIMAEVRKCEALVNSSTPSE
ncbi:hypothetical protein [Paracoccus yeei]|uniref:hypothetical protein n=1 Tax=Paracoccus yeei TaxID=147645 RepID=UPI0017495233|nr:hypothetical protein [Paracoccus yeei]